MKEARHDKLLHLYRAQNQAEIRLGATLGRENWKRVQGGLRGWECCFLICVSHGYAQFVTIHQPKQMICALFVHQLKLMSSVIHLGKRK